MGNEEILSKVKEILSKHLCVPESKINLDSILLEDLGVDSLDVIELVMALEEKYGIEIPDGDAEKLLTVREVVEYLESRIRK